MLEAFQASKRVPAQEAAPETTLAQPAPAVKSPGLDELPVAPQRRGIEPILAAGAGAMLLVVAFFLGRFSVGDAVQASNANETHAAGDADTEFDLALNQPVDSGLVETTPAPNNDAAPARAIDLAFNDAANRVTVRAQRYGSDESDRWTADYYYLQDLGLPVVQPIPDGEWVVLCVGAEPKQNDSITNLLETLRRLPDSSQASNHAAAVRQLPVEQRLASFFRAVQADARLNSGDTRHPFSSAYVDNISNIYQR